MDNIYSIAIDGPSGAGKSTIAKIISKKLNIVYLDTGSMYRAFTLYAINNNVDADEIDKINELLNSINIKFENENIYLNGINVSSEIRTGIIDKNVSKFSAIKEVREKMVFIQRNIASGISVIMDGRDIGSVVLKDATFKFYLDASEEIRARRRFLQLKDNNNAPNYEEILKDIIKRDCFDKGRKESPLIIPKDSVIIDSSNMNEDEVINFILDYIKK